VRDDGLAGLGFQPLIDCDHADVVQHGLGCLVFVAAAAGAAAA